MPRELAGDTYTLGVGDVDAITAMMTEGGVDVETINPMGGKCPTNGRGLEADDLHTNRGDGSVREVVGAMETVPGADVGAERGASEEVQGQLHLRKCVFPRLHRKIGVYGAKRRDQMVLKRTDISLRLVGLVVVRGNKLEGDHRGLLRTVTLQGFRLLIVHSLEARGDAVGCEPLVRPTVGGQVAGRCATRHRLDVDVVEARHDEKVLGARGTSDGETTRQIRVATDAVQRDKFCKHTGDRGRAGDRNGVQIVVGVVRLNTGGRVGAPMPVAGLVHMTFGGGNGVRREFADHVGSKAREAQTEVGDGTN